MKAIYINFDGRIGYDDTPKMFLGSNAYTWEFAIFITYYQNRLVYTILKSPLLSHEKKFYVLS